MGKDAMVVVDGGIKGDGTLTDISLSRVTKAAEMYRSGEAKRVILSGGGRGPRLGSPTATTEAHAMKAIAIPLGIPAENIFLEEKSKDLVGNAYFSKILYLEPSGWKNITVITSDYHKERAAYVFKKILGPNYSIDLIIADGMLSAERGRQLAIEEERKLALSKEWLEPIKDGDSPAIEAFIYHFHPYYSDPRKISNAQLRDRLKDY